MVPSEANSGCSLRILSLSAAARGRVAAAVRKDMAANRPVAAAREAMAGLRRGVSRHRRWAANSLPRAVPVMMYRFRAD